MNKWQFIKKFFFDSWQWENSEFPAFLKFSLNTFFYILTVLATIYFTPSINQKFENEKRKTAFYEKAINTLSVDTKDLLANLTIYVDTTFEQNIRKEAYLNIRKQITKLHWQRVEFQLLYKRDAKFIANLEKYSEALVSLSELTKSFNDRKNFEKLGQAFTNFGRISARLLEHLALKANIR